MLMYHQFLMCMNTLSAPTPAFSWLWQQMGCGMSSALKRQMTVNSFQQDELENCGEEESEFRYSKVAETLLEEALREWCRRWAADNITILIVNIFETGSTKYKVYWLYCIRTIMNNYWPQLLKPLALLLHSFCMTSVPPPLHTRKRCSLKGKLQNRTLVTLSCM